MEAKEIFGIRKINQNARCLGNPMFIGKKRSDSFAYLVDKIADKLEAKEDENPFMGRGGRATLLTCVLSSAPIYTMSLFKIPKKKKFSLTKYIRR